MTSGQRNYIRQKWSAEVTELDRDVVRAQERLDARLSRQQLNLDEVVLLEQEYQIALSLLAHLQQTNASAELIANQQLNVNRLQQSIAVESRGVNVLTDEEAYLQQSHIDQLQLQKQYRLDKIAEINAIDSN